MIFHFKDVFLQTATQPVANNQPNNNIIGWVLGFIIAAAVVTAVVWPLLNLKSFTQRNRSAKELELELDTLHDRLETEQLALSELEFDHDTGSLAEIDYAKLKMQSQSVIQSLEQEIKVLKQERDIQEEVPAENLVMATTAATAVPSVATTTSTNNLRRNGTGSLGEKRNVSKRIMVCSECKEPFKPEEKFCAKCGAPVTITCENCGAELSEDDRFCAKCGVTIHR